VWGIEIISPELIILLFILYQVAVIGWGTAVLYPGPLASLQTSLTNREVK
jgi:hypothetical protein